MTVHDPQRRTGILHETSRAALAADEMHVAEATESVEWERRGILQLLTRVRRERAADRD
jgi:hypothetical protein